MSRLRLSTASRSSRQGRRQLEAARVQQLVTLGRLSAQLLHDVSVPLTAASLHLEQADNQKSDFVRQARRSLRQLERYLEAARRQLHHSSTDDWFSVRHELRNLLVVLRPVARQHAVQIRYSQADDVWLHGDAVKFCQLVANLLTNAVEAYDDLPPGSRRRVVLAVCRNADAVELTVTDWGKGIATTSLPRLFEPFFTTKQTTRQYGLGIGLSIVRQIVTEDFHGTVRADSDPRRGTEFRVTLPGGRV